MAFGGFWFWNFSGATKPTPTVVFRAAKSTLTLDFKRKNILDALFVSSWRRPSPSSTSRLGRPSPLLPYFRLTGSQAHLFDVLLVIFAKTTTTSVMIDVLWCPNDVLRYTQVMSKWWVVSNSHCYIKSIHWNIYDDRLMFPLKLACCAKTLWWSSDEYVDLNKLRCLLE